MSLSGGVMFYDGEGIVTSGEPALVITNYFKKNNCSITLRLLYCICHHMYVVIQLNIL
jgi:hypothetical protein